MNITAAVSAQSRYVTGPYFPADTAIVFGRLSTIEEQAGRNIEGEYREYFQLAYQKRSSELREGIADSLFIFNEDVLEDVEEIMRRLIDGNDLTVTPLLFLSRSPALNASSYGDGIFVLNAGLFTAGMSREEIAYVLAHELGHDQLRHQDARLQLQASTRQTAPTSRKERRALRRRIDREGLGQIKTSIRARVYEQHRHSRAAELEADSIAIQYLIGAGISTSAAKRALDRMDPPSPFAVEERSIASALNPKGYPFKPTWTEAEKTLFAGSFGGAATTDAGAEAEDDFWQADSLQTHPERTERILAMNALLGTEAPPALPDTLPFYAGWAHREVTSSYLTAGLTAHSLTLALSGLARDPGNEFYIASVITALTQTHRAIYAHGFGTAVPPTRYFEDKGARAVVRFLHKIRASEIKRLTRAYATEQLAANPTSPYIRAAYEAAQSYFQF